MDIKYIANIAKIELKEKEIDKLNNEILSIIETFKLLNSINIENIQPTIHPFEYKNIWIKDEDNEYENNEILNNFKGKNKYFVVPKFIS